MHLSTNSPNPCRYSLDASNLPAMAMVDSFHLPTSQSPPHASPDAQPLLIPSNTSNVPTYDKQILPSFNTSFQPAFASSIAHIQQSIPHATTWIPSSMTVLPNGSASTSNNPSAGHPFQLPTIANVGTTQYQATQAPPVNPTHPLYANSLCPSNKPMLVSLPAVTPNNTVPPLPPISLPGTSNSFAQRVPSATTIEPTPRPTNEPIGKKAPKRKKRTSSTKRSRTKTAAPDSTKKASVVATTSMPSCSSVPRRELSVTNAQTKPTCRQKTGRPRDVGEQHHGRQPTSEHLQSVVQPLRNGAKQSRSTPSSIPATREAAFTAQQPRQAALGLNFADVVLQTPGYRNDAMRSRYEPWRTGLKAREKVPSHQSFVTAGDDLQAHGKIIKAPNREDVNPQLPQHMSACQNTQTGSTIGQVTRSDVATLPSEKPVAGRGKRSHVNRRGQADGKKGRDRNSVQDRSANYHDMSCSISASVMRQDREKLPTESSVPSTEYQGASISGSKYYDANIPMNRWNENGKGNPRIPCNEENEENAVESLMTLAGGMLASNTKERRGTVVNSKRGAHLNEQHSVHAPHNKGDCGMQISNNFGNFQNDGHLRNSAYQFAHDNPSKHTCAPAIPGPSQRPVADPPQPAEQRVPSAKVPSEGTPADCTESTPVDIRDTRDMFTRPSTASLPNASRNRSLAQERLMLEQYLAASDQGREKFIPNPSQSSQDLGSPLRRPSHLACPLFHEGDFVQSPHNQLRNPSFNPSQPQSNGIARQGHINQPEHNQPMHPSADLTQAFSQIYALTSTTSLAPPPPHFQSSDTVHTQSALPLELQQVTNATFEQPTMSPTDKLPAKICNPCDPSKVTKRTKATSKRSSGKTPRPRRPRPSKKNPAPSPRCGPDSVSPLPSSGMNTTTPPSLWTRGSPIANDVVVPLTACSLPSSANGLHQEGTQKSTSAEARANGNAVHNLSCWRAAQTAEAANGMTKPSSVLPKDTAPTTAKKTKTGHSRSKKVSGNKSHASIEKVLKAAAKAARSKPSMQGQTKPPVVNKLKPQSLQQPQRAVDLRPFGPHDSSRTVLPLTAEAQEAFATSMQQNRSQKKANVQAQANEKSQAASEVLQDSVPARILSEKGMQKRDVIPHTRVLTDPSDENQDASSPTTESTQQSLPLDTSSAGPSDAENPSNPKNIPLVQTQKRARSLPVLAPRASDSKVKTKGAKMQQQTERLGVSQQSHTLVPTGTDSQTDKILGRTACPAFQGLAGDIPSTPSRKRPNSSKSTDMSKKRKRNPINNSRQTSLAGKKKSQKDKNMPLISEETTQDTVMDSQQDVPPESNRATVPKKSVMRGQSKKKMARQSTPARKRSLSSTKTQAKEKLKHNASRVNGTAVRRTADGSSNLRLCLSVREKGDRAAVAAEVRPSKDSCGSPVTPDRSGSGFRDIAKAPPNTEGDVQKSSVEADSKREDKKTRQATPCFAEELKNLRISGILKASEGVSVPSSEIPHGGLPNKQKVLCVLCQHQGPHNEMVKHPCFPVRAFDICKPCSKVISKRVEELGVKRKTVAVPSEESITQRTTLFVMLIEEMVRHFSPTDRENRDVDQVYDFITNRNWTELVQRAESLSVDLNMLTVLRVALRKVGFTVRGGKLRWPAGDFTLPAFADTRALVAHALPARIDDLRKGVLPGEAAWNETFGSNEGLSKQRSSCAIYEKIFGLIGLRLVHATDCNTSDLSSNACKVRFDPVSIGALMYRTAAMLSGTVTQELLAASWTKDEAFRFINETEIELRTEPYEGTLESCCICGGSDKPQDESCSFRFSKCSECCRSFCSVCLLNVLGTSEYFLSFSDGGYFCMMCRFQKNAELCPNGKTNRGNHDRRLRLHDVIGVRKRTERRIRSTAPLLLLSSSVRAKVLLGLESSEARKAFGVAKFCEVANDSSVRNGMGSQNDQAFHDVCLECKLPVDGAEQDCSQSEGLCCGYEDCINVMHKTCLAPQRQARRRGSRSKWSCPHHQCSKCDQRDESKLLRCRTCPTTFCKEHMPSPSEVYLFSEKSFACSRCVPFLRVPQLLRLKPQGSKSERKRNQFAQALAIDQRKRTAVVKKLSEGSGCYEGICPAFNEFRRELEMK